MRYNVKVVLTLKRRINYLILNLQFLLNYLNCYLIYTNVKKCNSIHLSLDNKCQANFKNKKPKKKINNYSITAGLP